MLSVENPDHAHNTANLLPQPPRQTGGVVGELDTGVRWFVSPGCRRKPKDSGLCRHSHQGPPAWVEEEDGQSYPKVGSHLNIWQKFGSWGPRGSYSWGHSILPPSTCLRCPQGRLWVVLSQLLVSLSPMPDKRSLKKEGFISSQFKASVCHVTEGTKPGV